MSDKVDPLWSNQRIGEAAYAEKHFYANHLCSDGVEVKLRTTPTIYCADLMRQVRDEYETERAALTARVAELEAENNQMYEQVRKLPIKWGLELGAMQTRIAELEARLAAGVERWEPVPDGEYITPNKSQLKVDERDHEIAVRYWHHDELEWAWCQLPANWQLCRLTASPQPPAPQVTMPADVAEAIGVLFDYHDKFGYEMDDAINIVQLWLERQKEATDGGYS